LLELAREKEMRNLKFAVGGVIPPEDVNHLKELGVHAVFTSGTSRDIIIDALKALS
jgi:methylmalonyl-CoA mutase cobalamin-binding domain/chain